MYKYFYIPPEYNLDVIKWQAFSDTSVKLKNHGYKVKKSLTIQPADTVEIVMSSTQNINTFNPAEFECAVEKWCSPKEGMSRFLRNLSTFINCNRAKVHTLLFKLCRQRQII